MNLKQNYKGVSFNWHYIHNEFQFLLWIHVAMNSLSKKGKLKTNFTTSTNILKS